jgi:hypothetical protein
MRRTVVGLFLSLFLSAVVLLALPLGGLGGCNKGKGEDTTSKSKLPEPTPPIELSSKGEKMEKCRQHPNYRMVTLDLNRDKKRDRWLLYSPDGRKLCHEMDTDYDGKRDVSIAYYDDGVTPKVVWWDLDYDGVWDQVMYNRPDGAKERVEILGYTPTPAERKSVEWKPMIWKYYRTYKGKGALIERVEMDKDRNGYRDYWERYEEGVLKEVSWANPGDTDEKPKHWIESPEEGRDIGFRGSDETGGGQPGSSGKGGASDKPAPGSDKPAPGGDKPAPGGDKPAPGSDKPTPGSDKPAPGGDRPAPRPGGDRPAPAR